jgi:hypothetical protein
MDYYENDARCDVCIATKIRLLGFWVMTPRTGVVGYQHFAWPRCLHLQNLVYGRLIIQCVNWKIISRQSTAKNLKIVGVASEI